MASKINEPYEEAFLRNRGIISPEEQLILKDSRVAIAGMGGVGGANLVNLVRQGVGSFSIADPDFFEQVNTNRQYGATRLTMGRNKAEVMAEVARSINPELELRVFPELITPSNQNDFLIGANVLVDSLDSFNFKTRRHLFAKAAELNIPVVSAGPIGFGTAWLIFHPKGMSFDEYMDINDSMEEDEAFAAFIVGVAPAMVHLSYLDPKFVDIEAKFGPSVSSACFLSAGVSGMEVIRLLLDRQGTKFVPEYQQFDPYLGKFKSGRLRWGNRGLIQRIKRWFIVRLLRRSAKSRS